MISYQTHSRLRSRIRSLITYVQVRVLFLGLHKLREVVVRNALFATGHPVPPNATQSPRPLKPPFFVSQPKPQLTSRQIGRDAMADRLSENTLHILAVIAHDVPGLGEVLGLARGLLGHAEHVRPLLDLLLVVLGRDGGVDAAVPDLHLGAGRVRRVVRVHAAGDGAPRLGRRDRLAPAAGVVPLGDAGAAEAAGRHAAVRRHRLDQVRVRGREHVGHHRPAGAPRHVHPLRVRRVLRDGELDHVADGRAVAAAVPRQRLRRRHVPARPTVRRRRPHRHVPLPVRPLLPRDRGVLEVRLRRGLARVQYYYQRRVLDNVVGYVDVPVLFALLLDMRVYEYFFGE